MYMCSKSLLSIHSCDGYVLVLRNNKRWQHQFDVTQCDLLTYLKKDIVILNCIILPSIQGGRRFKFIISKF